MNKAFVKENEESTEDGPPEGQPLLPRGVKNYITPKGAKVIENEIYRLMHEERPKIVETVSWAASNGDRSENADYIYGKRRLREIDSRVRFLTKRQDSFELIDPEKQQSDRILFGATVTVLNEDDEKKMYRIVGIDETDATQGKVSWISPIGKALLQAKVNDVVTARTPKGEVDLEVLTIEYVKIP